MSSGSSKYPPALAAAPRVLAGFRFSTLQGSLSSYHTTPIDLTGDLTPCRFRCINVDSFMDFDLLLVEEGVEPHEAPYAVVSYVWHGLPTDTHDPDSQEYWKDELGTFHVKLKEDPDSIPPDPISLDVLRHICTLCLQQSPPIRRLWLDRVCIMQTHREDKAWQIRQMYDIYESSALCVVLPGGMRRLAKENEQTEWLNRGWTLQEALLPRRSFVLFAPPHLRPSVPRNAVIRSQGVTPVVLGTSMARELEASLAYNLPNRDPCECYQVTINGREHMLWKEGVMFGTMAGTCLRLIGRPPCSSERDERTCVRAKRLALHPLSNILPAG